MHRDHIFKEIKACLANVLNDRATAILFGSQARGDYRPDSDWDLLIILHNRGSIGYEDIGRLSLPLYSLAAELDVEINPVIINLDDWEKRNFHPLYQNIKSEGVRIWG